MESDDTRAHLREALRMADRAEAAPWTDYPPTPRWWPPLFALWTLAFGLEIGYLDGLSQALTTLALAALMGVVIGWQRAYRGTYPTACAPREFRASLVGLVAGALVIVLLARLLGLAVAPWLGAVLAALGVLVLVHWYERVYARTADRVRARLR